MTDIEYLHKYMDKNQLEHGISLLNQGVPVQYIVGNVDFYGNLLKVNPDVLIPRFETEELVFKTIERLKDRKELDIVDLGTGSGCIAITLKKMLDCNVDAVDISKKALEVAKENAKLNNVKIHFYCGDMLRPLSKQYDCIISNPPYLDYEEEIMEIVKKNEPAIALYANNHGLYYYEQILKEVTKYLKHNGLIAFEIGYLQGDAMKKLVSKYLKGYQVDIEKDLQGKDRFAFIYEN